MAAWGQCRPEGATPSFLVKPDGAFGVFGVVFFFLKLVDNDQELGFHCEQFWRPLDASEQKLDFEWRSQVTV